MKSNSSKRGTISSFFLSATGKKQKTDDQTSNTTSTSAEIEITSSETSNLLIVNLGGIRHVSEPVSSPTTSSSLASNTCCPSTDSPSEPISSPMTSSSLANNTRCPSTDSPSELVSSPTTSSSILSISPSTSSTDTRRSSIGPLSQPVSPSLVTSPTDISRSA